jgi:hypothetical protein
VLEPPVAPKTAETAAPAPGKAASGKLALPPGLALVGAIFPASFEFRPCGVQFEIEGDDDADPFALEAVKLSLTRFLDYRGFNGEMLAELSERAVEAKLDLALGKAVLLGTLSAPSKTGHEHGGDHDTLSLAFIENRPVSMRPSPFTMPAGEASLARLEVYSLPKQDAQKWLGKDLEDAALYSRLTEAVKAGSADLERLLSARCELDKSCSIVEADRYRFPSEYDRVQMPQELMISDPQLLDDLRRGNQRGVGTREISGNGGFGLATQPTACSFQERMLGTSLVLQLSAKKDFFATEVNLQLSRLLGERNYSGALQPVFESMKLETAVTLAPGIPRLLGSLSRPVNTGIKEGHREDGVWLAFLTVGK